MPVGKQLTAADDKQYSKELRDRMLLQLARDEVAEKSGPRMVWDQFLEGASAPIKSFGARAGTAMGLPGALDDPSDVLRANQARQAAASETYPENNLGYAGQMAMGAAQNLPGMMASGAVGGLPGMIGYFSASAYDQGYVEAIDSGLGEDEARAFARREALIEGGITLAMSKIGLGGAEKSITRGPLRSVMQSAKKQSLKKAVTDELRRIGVKELTPEIVEEVMIETASNFNSAWSDVDPEAADGDRMYESARDAAAQTVITMGLLGTANVAGQQARRQSIINQQKARIDEKRSARETRRQMDEESRRRAQQQIDEPVDDTASPDVEPQVEPAEEPEQEPDQEGPTFERFPTESGTLGIPRADMPQVKSEQRGALANYARSRGVEFERTEVLPTDLKPSQSEFSPEKVEDARQYDGPERAILVSEDGYIIDGHHQWLKSRIDNPDAPIPVIRLGAPAQDVIKLVRDFPSSQTDDSTATGDITSPETPAEPQPGTLPEIPDEPRDAEREPVTAPSPEPAGTLPEQGESPTVDGAVFENVEVGGLTVDPGRFQFKENANESGVVEPLEGEFNPLAAGTILVWEDKDGNRFPVNGHHRTELAKRKGVERIPAQIVREADGVTADQARVLGAEINILEGQGKIDDYAQFFRESGIDEPTAESRGLLARDKGKTGFLLGKYADDNTWAGFRSGKLPAGKAAIIADVGRGDEGLQALGVQKAGSLNADQLRGFLESMKASPRSSKPQQGTLFGYDDTAILEAEKIAKAAAAIIKEKKARVLAVRGALKRPEEAAKTGLTGDMESIRQQVEDINADLDRWTRWYTDPELAAQARQRAGLSDTESPETNLGNSEVEKPKPPKKRIGPQAEQDSLPDGAVIEKGDDGLFYPSTKTKAGLPQSSLTGFKTEAEAREWFKKGRKSVAGPNKAQEDALEELRFRVAETPSVKNARKNSPETLQVEIESVFRRTQGEMVNELLDDGDGDTAKFVSELEPFTDSDLAGAEGPKVPTAELPDSDKKAAENIARGQRKREQFRKERIQAGKDQLDDGRPLGAVLSDAERGAGDDAREIKAAIKDYAKSKGDTASPDSETLSDIDALVDAEIEAQIAEENQENQEKPSPRSEDSSESTGKPGPSPKGTGATAPESGSGAPPAKKLGPKDASAPASIPDGWQESDIQFLRDKIADGAKVFVFGGDKLGLPVPQSVLQPAEHVGMGYFETKTDDYTVQWEAGGSARRTPDGEHGYTVLQETSGEFPYDQQAMLDALDKFLPQGDTVSPPAKTKLQGARDKARTEKEALRDEFIEKLRKKRDQANTGLDPELASIAVRYSLAAVKERALTFAAFVESVVNDMPDDLLQEAIPYFESAWRRLHARGMVDEPAGTFDEVLNTDGTVEPGEEQTLSPSEQDISLADRVAPLLGTPDFDRKAFFKLADEVYGGTRADGVYGDSRAYDALELAVNQRVSEMVAEGDIVSLPADGVARKVAEIESFMESVPVHKARTGEKDTLQQFSTPPAYAYVTNWIAGLQKGDIYLEPSAGVGGLAMFGKKAGAQVIVNELDENRLTLMRELGFTEYLNEDAEQIDAILFGKATAPTVAVMNPPFSRAGRRMGNKMQVGMDRKHMDRVLAALPDGGRLVAIVGAGLHGQSQGMTNWLSNLPYQVRANVEVPRSVYKGYGTQFPTRVLVIDKLAKDAESATVEAQVESLAELAETLEGVRNERRDVTRPVEPAPVESTGAEGTGSDEGSNQPDDDAQSSTGPVGTRPGSESGGGSGNVGAGATTGTRGGGRSPGETGGASGGRSGGGRRPRGRSGKGSGKESSGTDTKRDGSTTGKLPGGRDPRGLTLRPLPKSVRKVEQLTESTYEPYVPSIEVEGANPHPASIVESAAMSAVDAPPITYTPEIDQAVVEGYVNENGEQVGISLLQLEAVAAAGQSHQKTLPDGTRRGYLIGDGTGVGKAREAAGIILDNWNQGRKKAVWISKNFKLFDQAKEEWERVGGDPDDFIPMNKVKSGTRIQAGEGVLFSAYATVRKKPTAEAKEKGHTLSRVDQIVDWVGEGYDGVIVFDEAHAMGNAVSIKKTRGKSKASSTALAGLELQERLPNARIVYMSATAATEVHNLAFAPRLGLWGRGTHFSDVRNFINRITAGGVAAMEKVASDMKAMGLYTSRNLSFADGTDKGTVEFDRVAHELTPDQRKGYDAASEAWQVVLSNINEAMGITNADQDSETRGAIMSQFWRANQLFWNNVVMSMMTPTLIRKAESDLESGRSVLIQLTSTGDAAMDRAINRLTSDQSLEDVDASPVYTLIDMVKRAFPIHRFVNHPDENGNDNWVIELDSNGNPIVDPRALQMREALIDRVSTMPISNLSALDEIIRHFGHTQVAEITGRSKRLVEKDGEIISQTRGDAAAKADKAAFMAGKKRILIFSEAGGTGASYHADLTKENQQRRSHYLLQAGWKADVAVQGLGRGHRANQASAPILHLLEPDLPGYKRFISTIARRLAQLGALTKGQREAGDSGVFNAADNLESPEASKALRQLIEEAHAGRNEAVTLEFIEERMGLDVTNDDGTLKAALPPIRTFLNRVLNLSIGDQNTVYNEFDDKLQQIIEDAIANDTLDQGMETIKTVGAKKKSETVANTHSTGAETKHVVVDVKTPVSRRTFDEAEKNFAKDKIGYFLSRQSGKVFLMADAKQTEQDKAGRLHKLARQIGVDATVRKVRIPNLNNSANWKEIDRSDAMSLWESEYEKHKGFSEKEMHLITGALLPVWNNLPDENPKVKRLLTDDGEQILGRIIEPDQLADTLRRLGVSYTGPVIGADEAAEVVGQGGKVKLAGNWTIRTTVFDGERSIVLEGPQDSDWPLLEPMGISRRRIQSRMRYFIPISNPTPVIRQLVDGGRKVMSVVRPKRGSDSYTGEMTNAKRRKIGKQEPNAENRISRGDVIKTWERLFDVPIRQGGFKGTALGKYYSVDAKFAPEVVRLKEKNAFDLAVASHEIAHHIDRKMDLRGERLRDLRKYDPTLHGIVKSQLLDMDYDNKRKASGANPDTQLKEGIAEAFRHILTGTYTEASSHAEAIDWVRTEVTTHPVFGPAMLEAIGHVEQSDAMSPLDAIMSQVGKPPKDLDRMERFKQQAATRGFRTIENMFDRSRILHIVQQEARKKGYKGIGIEDAYFAYTMSAGHQASKAFEHGLHSVRTLEQIGRHGVYSLADLVNDDADEEKAVAYAYARHAVYMRDLKDQRGERTFNAGIDPEIAQEYLDSVDPEDEIRYEQYALRISEILDDVLEMLKDAGVLALSDVENIRNYYQDNMFSLMRATDDDQVRAGTTKFVNLPKPLMARSSRGSDRAILHPVDALMRKIQQGYVSASRHRIADALVKNLEGAEGMGEYGMRLEPGTKPFKFRLQEIMNDLVSNKVIDQEFSDELYIASLLREGWQVAGDDVDQFYKKHGLDPESPDFDTELDEVLKDLPDIMTFITLWRPHWTPNQQKATVVIRRNDGSRELWELDRNLYDLATGMKEEQIGEWMSWFKAVSKPFRAGAVLMNSGFGLFNLMADYWTFVSRSRYTGGSDTWLSPWGMLAAVLRYKVANAVGYKVENELVEMLEESGGAMFSRIGFDIDSLERARRRSMSKAKAKRRLRDAIVLGPTDSVKNVVDRMQDVIAISDMPPRLAEMKGYLESKGYKLNKDGKFVHKGRVAKRLPEQVRVEAISAAAEATTNFKRSGRASRVVDIFLPFFNATLQAHYRTAKQVKNLGTKEREQEFKNTLMYFTAMIPAAIGYALLRGDDEDYVDQHAHDRDRFWSWGKDGTTWVTLPKPRDFAVVFNMVESLVAKARDIELADRGDDALHTIYRDARGKLPTGGGILMGGLEVWANWDNFRWRKLEADYQQDTPKAFRTSPYTTRLSDQIGKVTGQYLNLSPIQFQHLTDSYSGGAFSRWTGVGEAAIGALGEVLPGEVGDMMSSVPKRRLGAREVVPGLRAVMKGFHQSASVGDVYTESDRIDSLIAHHKSAMSVAAAEIEDEASREAFSKEHSERIAPLVQKARKLSDAKTLMGLVRKAEPRERGGARTFKYEPYVNGIARDALGRDPSPNSPNPFRDPDVPEPIREALTGYVVKKAMPAVALYRMPQSDSKTEGPLLERLKDYEAMVLVDRRWINDHADSPIVQDALRVARASKKYQERNDLKRPEWDYDEGEPWAEHQADMKRYELQKRLGRQAPLVGAK